tara:strand:+ start:55 stop:513 length:459 start_codon:yes stop_codon:yes gene_type:complete
MDFTIIEECSFKLYPFIEERVILDSMLAEIKHYKLPKEVYNMLMEAWNSRFWVTLGYDGATVIHNKKHTSTANFLHDYLYRSGYATRYKDGKKVDFIYKEMLKLTGYSNYIAVKRHSLIRVFGSIFRIRHRIRGNKRMPSKEMIRLYNKLKS